MGKARRTLDLVEAIESFPHADFGADMNRQSLAGDETDLVLGSRIDTPLRQRENAMTLDQATEFANSGRLFVTADQAPYCPAWVLERATLYRHGPVFRVELSSGQE